MYLPRVGRSYVLGATVTISATSANVLIAFLALYVAWTATNSWAILCFIAYQLRWTDKAEDGLFWQVQALFRSEVSDIGMAARLAEVAWCWKRRTKRVAARISPIILICIVHFSIFAVAGLFSSRIADAANEVLLVPSNHCGTPDITFSTATSHSQPLSLEELDDLDSLVVGTRQSLQDTKEISRTCYSRLDGTVPDSYSSVCQHMIVPSIASAINRSDECPFESAACASSVLSMDTGLLDSHTHFGINSPRKDRIQFRRRTTCTILPLENRYKVQDPSFGDPGTDYYYFGDLISVLGIGQDNYTMSLANISRARMGTYAPM
jgi:hypothetical protein